MNFITFLKAFAILLITNSHFDGLYPPALSALATGGNIGNALFFFCSGYTLFLSKKVSFRKWIWRRYTRIYPSIWIALIVLLLLGKSVSPISFIIPPYWFLAAILLFYLIFYFVAKFLAKYMEWIIVGLAILMVIAYFIIGYDSWIIDTSGTPHINWFYDFGIMLMGGIIARDKIPNTGSYKLRNFLLLAVSIILLYSIKYFSIKYLLPTLQLIYPIFLYFIAYYFFKCSGGISEHTFKPIINKILTWLSKLTLDIYVVQMLIIKYFVGLSFPLGFIAASVSILVLAMILHYLSGKVVDLLQNNKSVPVVK